MSLKRIDTDHSALDLNSALPSMINFKMHYCNNFR